MTQEIEELKTKLAHELERYHRNSCYPNALEVETEEATRRIIEILKGFERDYSTGK
jgi:hypothetical protein